LTFQYAVQPDDHSSDLNYVSTSSLRLPIPSNATIHATDSPSRAADVALPRPDITKLATNPADVFGSLGLNKDIVIDAMPPVFENSALDEGTGILLVTFSETVDVSETDLEARRPANHCCHRQQHHIYHTY